jgi:transcriptional regulator with XRE-family HTH domain
LAAVAVGIEREELRMDDEDSIGRRVAFYRAARGKTQSRLAMDAAVSLSLVRKIEQGSRDATQPVVAAFARALGVDVRDLTGQPYFSDGPSPDKLHSLMPSLRRALTYWDLPQDLDIAPRTAEQLAGDTAEVARLYQLDKNIEVLERLPALLTEGFAALHTGDDDEQREALLDALCGMFYAAHAVTYQTGYEDLSVVIEDRLQWAARQSADPAARGFADWMRTTSLMRMAEYDAGLRMLDDALTVVEPGSRRDDGALRMTGSLHLRSAILAARAGRLDDAMGHIGEARQIATGLDADTDNDWRHLAFGPTNVAIHAVAAAVEADDGPRALALAADVRVPDEVTRRMPIRTAHHHMDVARAQLWQNKRDDALKSLLRAKQLAPQQTRHHPTTREVTRMLVRAHRHVNEPLAKFSTWIGAV